MIADTIAALLSSILIIDTTAPWLTAMSLASTGAVAYFSLAKVGAVLFGATTFFANAACTAMLLAAAALLV